MFIPSSTYRLQFNSGFTFSELRDVIPYFEMLHPGAVYASPVFSAVPGSNHGYDITDPLQINSDIGSADEFIKLIRRLKAANIGWIQDIVPNHMAFHSNNLWLMDVLKNGRRSSFAGFFDIDWDHPAFRNKVMVPVLGKPLEDAIRENEIKLTPGKELFLTYFDIRLPLSPDSHQFLEKEFHGKKAIELTERINHDERLLTELLNRQHYVLTFWRDTSQTINYRRFFTINGLISLRMEDEHVFDTYHELIFKFTAQDLFSGLRIDHIDGLKLPAVYFDKLRSVVGEEKYIVVEKILAGDEKLDPSWPVQGSTGYDFLSLVNGLFTNCSSIPLLRGFFREINQDGPENGGEDFTSPEEFILNKKKLILDQNFGGDLDNLCRTIAGSGLYKINDTVTPATLKQAVGLFLVLCPVYKLYSEQLPLTATDAETIDRIFQEAVIKRPDLKMALEALKAIFLTDHGSDEANQKASGIFLRVMQYSGPLMAKGIEDTAMYAWPVFIAHNEVGDHMDANGVRIREFHQRMEERRRNFPASMNATATHDTKRGEDVRARLNVISDMPDEWIDFIRESINLNENKKSMLGGKKVPDTVEEYFIYQTLLGAMPMSGIPDENFVSRIEAYFIKVLREAKVHSDWNEPDTAYEEAVLEFTRSVIADRLFMKNLFTPLFNQIKKHGVINSLSQLVLKCTCPGIPDFYQGTELWDLSLVDPDNRRPVDYAIRKDRLDRFLKNEKDDRNFVLRLINSPDDGSIKLWITSQLMKARAEDPQGFVKSDYLPLNVTGDFRENILSFARRTENYWYITIIPLQLADIMEPNKVFSWKNTRIELPEMAPQQWEHLWDYRNFQFQGKIDPGEVLHFNTPAVIKAAVKRQARGSGILLHITSLPGKHGSGTLGGPALDFIDFLRKSGQKYWQILPFNPTGPSWSPYSSSSAFAGNTVLIDQDALLVRRNINSANHAIHESSVTDFKNALRSAELAIATAYNTFRSRDRKIVRERFSAFCRDNKFWLDDFVLFSLLKNEFGEKTWNTWPHEFRDRHQEALENFQAKHEYETEQIKFGQFLFNEQFLSVKAYAGDYGIKIIGDIPIYVSYDSADVWANPELFNLDKNKRMKTVAGVPPDFFSKNGQLWNMPVYNWKNLKASGYTWWKNRIRRNLEFCHLLRFDHFRGFSAYWEVNADLKTARHGRWAKGPSVDFFNQLKSAFAEMPFIAEDLGDIDADVYKLRDTFALPGMVVLQFAFGERRPGSVHMPHNHGTNSIVYTGTHDNNTTKGWFRELRANDREGQAGNSGLLGDYSGRKITLTNVAAELLRLAYASVAKTAIIPMQDLLDLDESARLNTPSRAKGNWLWKLKLGYADKTLITRLLHLAFLYGRI